MCGDKIAWTFQIPVFSLLCFAALRVVESHFMWATAFPEYQYLLKGTCALHLAKPQSTRFPFPMAKPKLQPVLDWNPPESTKIPQIFSIWFSRSKESFS